MIQMSGCTKHFSETGGVSVVAIPWLGGDTARSCPGSVAVRRELVYLLERQAPRSRCWAAELMACGRTADD